jgi:hypothetical protein
MKRFWAVILAAAALTGCRSSQPATNPFLRTTVPPPATGEGAVVVPGEPYGAAPPPGVVAPAAPGAVAPAPVAPPALDLRHPPGGDYQYHQSSVGQPGAGKVDTVDAAAPGAIALGGPSNAVQEALALSREPIPTKAVNYEEFGGKLPGEVLPGERPRGGDASAEEQRDALRPASTLRIVGGDAGSSTATMAPVASVTPPSVGPPLQVTVGGGSQPGVATPAVAAASSAIPAGVAWNPAIAAATTKQPSEPAAAPATPAATARAEYAFTPDYTSLSGRLEYSQTARQWKLRYIPIDGKTDSYGGSVVLPNSPEMASFKSGDRVAVRGRLAGGPSTGSFSPLYQLERVERVSP